jgi:peptidoglycan-associated lipoprotein
VNRVHFDLDSAELHAADLATVQREARCLAADRSVHLVVEGNADERGSVRYNLRLAERRAEAVAQALERAGVPASQLTTVSYGKELPLCTAHDEACWSTNRRAAMVPNGAPKLISRLEQLDEQAERLHKPTAADAGRAPGGKAKTASATP